MVDYLLGKLSPDLQHALSDVPSSEKSVILLVVLFVFIIIILIYALIFLLLMKINKKVFTKLAEKNGHSITYQFLSKAIALAIIVLFIVLPLGGEMLGQSLLGSTAVVAAVVGLAANDVIKDMFAGLQISIYKPFDVGSRIMLEDGRAGIVESVTLRHVVLALMDSTKLIVPNSKANSMIIVNYSYSDDVPKAFDLRYGISYDSDVDKAKEVIRKTICDCPLTLNKDNYKEDDPNSRSVYFLSFDDSALIIGATVYYPQNLRTEVVKDEVNTRVFKALADNGIEIPYNYVNVVMSNKE